MHTEVTRKSEWVEVSPWAFPRKQQPHYKSKHTPKYTQVCKGLPLRCNSCESCEHSEISKNMWMEHNVYYTKPNALNMLYLMCCFNILMPYMWLL